MNVWLHWFLERVARKIFWKTYDSKGTTFETSPPLLLLTKISANDFPFLGMHWERQKCKNPLLSEFGTRASEGLSGNCRTPGMLLHPMHWTDTWSSSGVASGAWGCVPRMTLPLKCLPRKDQRMQGKATICSSNTYARPLASFCPKAFIKSVLTNVKMYLLKLKSVFLKDPRNTLLKWNRGRQSLCAPALQRTES